MNLQTLFRGFLIILICTSLLSQAARRYARKPGESSKLISTNIDEGLEKMMKKVNMAVGDVRKSHSIMQPMPTGSPSSGKIPAEPMRVHYTHSEKLVLFPWITRPVEYGVFSNRTKDFKKKRSVYRRVKVKNDGFTRFNNPDYLREQFEGLNRDEYSFQPREGVRSANGKYKVKLTEKWRGIPVYGCNIVLEQEKDTNMILESADGEFLSGIEEDIPSEVPAISKQDAVQRAINRNNDDGDEVKHTSAKLTVNTIGDKAVLAYLINYFIPGDDHPVGRTMEPAAILSNTIKGASTVARERAYMEPVQKEKSIGRRPWVIMDANTGQIYEEWEGLESIMTVANIPLLLGTQNSTKVYTTAMIQNTKNNRCYYQRPLGDGKYLTVRDINALGSNFRYAYSFPCKHGKAKDYDVTNGAQSPRNAAYKWASDGIDFFSRTSNSTINFNVDVQVHNAGPFAGWTGQHIFLGDGSWYSYPMTGPDVVVHEFAHAFTEHKSDLQSRAQSAAIGESYADMAACAFMNELKNDSTDSVYRIGSTVVKYSLGIRDMCNPRSSDLIYYKPEKPVIINATFWERTTGQHNASALYSKAFCILSKTPGWNIQLAFKVFTNANIFYWGPKETFNTGACGVKKAARDMFNTAQALRDVDVAFAAVGISCDAI